MHPGTFRDSLGTLGVFMDHIQQSPSSAKDLTEPGIRELILERLPGMSLAVAAVFFGYTVSDWFTLPAWRYRIITT